MKRSSLRNAGSVAALTTVVLGLMAGCGAIVNRPGIGGADVVRGFHAVAFSTPDEMREAVLFYGDKHKLTKLTNIGLDVWSVDMPNKRAKVKMNQAQANSTASWTIGRSHRMSGLRASRSTCGA